MKQVKTSLRLLLLIIAPIFTVSCNRVDSSQIEGRWGCVHSKKVNRITGVESIDSYRGSSLILKKNGEYVASADIPPFDREWSEFNLNLTWMIDGDTLIVDGVSCYIQSLNNTTLRLSVESVRELDYDGYYSDTTYDISYEFRKQ